MEGMELAHRLCKDFITIVEVISEQLW